MTYSAYAGFYRSMKYKVFETPNGFWIGPSHGLYVRMPLYETAPISEEDLRTLYNRFRAIGVNYATKPEYGGIVSHNYFIRDRNYCIDSLPKKGRWSVRKGLDRCQIREIDFDELYRLGLSLNLDTLGRQNRHEKLFANSNGWGCLCKSGEVLDQVQAWGAFVGNQLGSYIVTIRVGNVVSLLYNSSCNDLLNCHCASALFFTVAQKMIQSPGVDAVYNGTKRLNMSEGLDRFKTRMGFSAEPVVHVLQLRPVVRRVLLNRMTRRTISSVEACLLKNDFHQRIEMTLEMAEASPGNTLKTHTATHSDPGERPWN